MKVLIIILLFFISHCVPYTINQELVSDDNNKQEDLLLPLILAGMDTGGSNREVLEISGTFMNINSGYGRIMHYPNPETMEEEIGTETNDRIIEKERYTRATEFDFNNLIFTIGEKNYTWSGFNTNKGFICNYKVCSTIYKEKDEKYESTERGKRDYIYIWIKQPVGTGTYDTITSSFNNIGYNDSEGNYYYATKDDNISITVTYWNELLIGGEFSGTISRYIKKPTGEND